MSLASPYSEGADRFQPWIDEALHRGLSRACRWLGPFRLARLRGFAAAVEERGEAAARLSEARLADAAGALRARMIRHGMTTSDSVWAFALTREACWRQLGLRHYPVQIMGGACMLSRCIAEMETGEGKTITAALPAAAFALAGLPVHVVTVNNYLAERDAEQLRPVFAALGLTVGLVRQGHSPDDRRRAYAADVAYCTNKDLVFDYLRDRLALGRRRSRTRRLIESLSNAGAESGLDRLLLRGLHVAIVDEADSVLIDEARTPLILAGPSDQDGAVSAGLCAEALEIVGSLEPGHHWRLSATDRSVSLTSQGRHELARRASGREGLWIARRAREELAERALSALHLYARNTEYIVADGKVQIIDEFTGRIMPDRTWEFGLHQMIEAKEGVEITGGKVTLARLTFQRFFRRYRHLAGMTGTVTEVAAEVAGTYKIDVLRLPTHRPTRRRADGAVMFARGEDKWSAVVADARASLAAGHSVLIGTRSVELSERLSALLAVAALPHVVLNARQDRLEAEYVGDAGLPGRLTVATNMAGRGADIKLSPDVREAGGLRVVLTEYHESRRIDRQLFGRCARQGEPGSYACFAALDDEIVRRFAPSSLRRLALRLARGEPPIVPQWLARLLVGAAQAAANRRNAQVRRETMSNDQRLEKWMAFAGQSE